jgi:hypothetical protein
MAPITSTGNPAVKAARKLVRRHGRDRANAFLVEGPQAVREALDHLERLFVTEDGRRGTADFGAAAEDRRVDVLDVTDAVLASLADTVTPQGLVGIATLPDYDLDAVCHGASLIVILWEVADPGNAGTLVRTCDAAGADAVVLTTGSVDIRNPKAVRASVGSLFHLPVVDGAPGQLVGDPWPQARDRPTPASRRADQRPVASHLVVIHITVRGRPRQPHPARGDVECQPAGWLPGDDRFHERAGREFAVANRTHALADDPRPSSG